MTHAGIYPCPTCQRPTVWTDNPSRPFCSERCKLIDLGAWVSQSHRIAGEPAVMPTAVLDDDD